MTSDDGGLLSPVWAGTRAAEATSDRAWLQALLDAEAALARAQAELGLIPAAAAEAITRAARAGAYDLGKLAVKSRGAGNPVVAIVEELRKAAGEHVHHGATSQDIFDTAAMLVSARTREIILADLDRVLEALAGIAAAHRDTPAAGRTLGRQAVPITFGLKAAGWLLACLDARRRLAGVRLVAQLGGAAGTLAGYGGLELLTRYAQETGLEEPPLPWHADRSVVVEVGEALAAVTGALGKVATDVALLAQSEVGEVAEPAAPGRGVSSAMAHKRNPILATMIRSAALRTPGLVSVLLTAQAGAAHERPAGEWHAEWEPLRDCLRLTGGATETAAELLTGLEIFPECMQAHLDHLFALLPEADRTVGHAPELVDRALAYYRKATP